MRATDLLLETATTADHVASADALVYCVGALKFLSGTSTVIKVLARRNCLHSMAVLLAAINKTVRAHFRAFERARTRALPRAELLVITSSLCTRSICKFTLIL